MNLIIACTWDSYDLLWPGLTDDVGMSHASVPSHEHTADRDSSRPLSHGRSSPTEPHIAFVLHGL